MNITFFFVSVSLPYLFLSRAGDGVEGLPLAQRGKRRVRAGRVAAGQSACHPRRWGGRGIRAVCVVVGWW